MIIQSNIYIYTVFDDNTVKHLYLYEVYVVFE